MSFCLTPLYECAARECFCFVVLTLTWLCFREHIKRMWRTSHFYNERIFFKWPFPCLSVSFVTGCVSCLLQTRACSCVLAELLFVYTAVKTVWQEGFNYLPLGFNISRPRLSSLHVCPVSLFPHFSSTLANRNRITLCGTESQIQVIQGWNTFHYHSF